MIPALVLVDPEEGSGGEAQSAKVCTVSNHVNRFFFPESTDYSVLFYIFDGCLVVVLVLSFWLKVSMKRSGLTTKQSLKKIWNKASLIFFSILFIMGTLYGVKDTYLVPYLTDDLGASSQLISKGNVTVQMND